MVNSRLRKKKLKATTILTYLLLFAIVIGSVLYLQNNIFKKTVVGEAFKFIVYEAEYSDAQSFNIPLFRNQRTDIHLEVTGITSRARFSLSGTGEDIQVNIEDEAILSSKGTLLDNTYTISGFDGQLTKEIATSESISITIPNGATLSRASLAVNLVDSAEIQASGDLTISGVTDACIDGTPYGECNTLDWYCDGGELDSFRCDKCECSSANEVCNQGTGRCELIAVAGRGFEF